MVLVKNLMVQFLPIEAKRNLINQEAMKNTKIFKMPFADVYPHYVKKAEKKGRNKEQVDMVICWLTGYSEESLHEQIEKQINFETFFDEAPQIHPNASKIKGTICGHRVEEIEDGLMKRIRQMDKLVDELAKGKSIDKILRE